MPEIFKAENVLEQAQVERDETGYRATGADPRLVLGLPRPLGAGWYRFVLRARSSGRLHPRLRFGSGADASQAMAVDLSPQGDGAYAATVRLPRTDAVRLEPHGAGGWFEVTSLKVRRLRLPQLAAIAARRLAFTARHRPHELRRVARYAWSVARGRHFMHVNPSVPALAPTSFDAWIAKHDYDPMKHGDHTRKALAALQDRPLISVLMPVYDTPERYLNEAIASVASQIYEDWELCIANDGSSAPHVRPLLDGWAARDARVKVVHRTTNGHICEATNSAMALATGDWIALLDHDDVLREHALAEVALAIAARPDAALIYSDEDKIDAKGRRFDPYFKPDFSPELFLTSNYLNHLTVHRARSLREVGGWRKGFEGSQDYDVNLRVLERVSPSSVVHIPKVLYHWRAAAGSTALAGGEKGYAFTAAKAALQDHLERMDVDAELLDIAGVPHHRIRHRIPEPRPLVSMIVPTKDRADLLRRCLGSLLRTTAYQPFEVLVVDNGSVEPKTHDYFREIEGDPRVSVLRYDAPFNYSAINNFAARRAQGAMLALVNNDIEAIGADWLTEMVSWCQRPEIGCVGAKLYYDDDTIQHAGVVVGLGGVACHSHKRYPRTSPGYFHRLRVVSNYSAVTAACLLVRKEVYEEVGGLNGTDLAVAFNDVDFCLRVREAGYRNVWTPFAELYHLESVSRGVEDTPEKQKRFNAEIAYMKRRWEEQLRDDPFYSPNLTRAREDFSYLE